MPWINSPFLIFTKLSIKFNFSSHPYGLSSLNFVKLSFLDKSKLKICFPDYKGFGFNMKGLGISNVSNPFIHCIKSIICSESKKVSLDVNNLHTIKES